ncbi:hypothetical protein NDR87_23225 [Nocardia sp. CDC159]|uniref:Uncharacterized protein n=1 Tax=Nocardia pulmonis TaxID=2951408 RepID=A0A9X2J1C8_9NOCA|nr:MULTISPECIES: hypothetical protein [Nocardia]MCM6776861.1 hypothetical protein [Nocardia pulmonis]MCM6789285.1 hypothetical protein [Nocardia sp. CDC159]
MNHPHTPVGQPVHPAAPGRPPSRPNGDTAITAGALAVLDGGLFGLVAVAFIGMCPEERRSAYDATASPRWLALAGSTGRWIAAGRGGPSRAYR